MLGSLSGKVAVVTGAGRGIGAAIAEQVSADGARTIVNYHKSGDEADALVRKINASGGDARAVQADVSREDGIRRLFDEAERAFGPVTSLVNNAALRGSQTPAAELAPDEFRSLFAVNVCGPMICMTAFAKRAAPGGGRIVNITSGQARSPMPGAALYAGTKGALEALTRGFAADLGQMGIGVNACAPGATATDTFVREVPQDIQDFTAKNTALGRLGLPGDVAKIVSFLLSDQSEWLTGQVIRRRWRPAPLKAADMEGSTMTRWTLATLHTPDGPMAAIACANQYFPVSTLFPALEQHDCKALLNPGMWRSPRSTPSWQR